MTPSEQDEIADALVRLGLVGSRAEAAFERLPGGVSSDIYRVETSGATFCVKRALPQLRVEARWEVTVERNRYEYEWLAVAGGVRPGCVPRLLGRDDEAGVFAMAFLDPADHPVWKTHLLAGHADAGFSRQVGEVIGAIHAATADAADLAARFATDDLFRDLRLDPYLVATATEHPDLEGPILALGSSTAAHRRVLVHGDVSPKNILVGPTGPVLLDAECAWFGDPAFDLAFCLNHLVLKGFHRPSARADLFACFGALADGYLPHVIWEDPNEVDRRAAALLPALLLARVDGTSPVEYLDERSRAEVRATARRLLDEPPSTLEGLVVAMATGARP